MNKLSHLNHVHFESFSRIQILKDPAVACPNQKPLIPSTVMNKLELEYRALKLLEQQPDMTQRQIAEELNVSLVISGCCSRSLSAPKTVNSIHCYE
jgi:hypothetical protein